jgi:hypothetical protein
MRQIKNQYWVDESRLTDPMFWFMKAWFYRSASLLIMDEFSNIQEGGIDDKKAKLFNAINTVPYLTGLASELYMKGYLVFKGQEPSDLRDKKVGHNLKSLRERCLRYDQRFNNKALIFLTDRLGKHLMEDGGIRYPDKRDMPVYFDEFKNALEILGMITGEIGKNLATWIDHNKAQKKD